jgi:plastocyanin domain-containing protein
MQKLGLVSVFVSIGLSFCPSSIFAAEMHTEQTPQSGQFQRIEQPLMLKIAVAAGGIALIGGQLWWFLGSKPKSQQAEANDGIQEVSITVDGGYSPALVIVKRGQPVRLNFLRHDPSSCLEKVLLPDFHIAQDLALDQVTSVEFTPEVVGQYQFTCGMNMFRGAIEVKE